MIANRRSSVTNRLIQRVHRHAGLTTLFGVGVQRNQQRARQQTIMRSWMEPQFATNDDPFTTEPAMIADDWITGAESHNSESGTVGPQLTDAQPFEYLAENPVVSERSESGIKSPTQRIQRAVNERSNISQPQTLPLQMIPQAKLAQPTPEQFGSNVRDSDNFRSLIELPTTRPDFTGKPQSVSGTPEHRAEEIVRPITASPISANTQPIVTTGQPLTTAAVQTQAQSPANQPEEIVRPITASPISANTQPIVTTGQPSTTAAVQTQAQSPANQPATKSTATADEDPTWRRLQMILRRHEQNAARRQNDQNDGSEVLQTGSEQHAIPALGNTVQRHSESVATVNVPTSSSSDIEIRSPGTQSPTLVQAKKEDDASSDLGAANNLTNKQTQIDIVKNVADKPQSLPSSVPQLPVRGMVQRQPQESNRAESSVLPVAKTIPASESKVAATFPITNRPDVESTTERSATVPQVEAAETKEAEQRSSEQQPMPLEAVWPIQRTVEGTVQTDSTNPAQSDSLDPILWESGDPITPAEGAVLRSRLVALPTSQPTESKVDVVLPRRPRPIIRSAYSTDQSVSVPAIDTKLNPNASSDTALTAPAIQRSEEITANMGNESGAATSTKENDQSIVSAQSVIDTEIGPLPSDLWTLIGEKPPQPTHPVAWQNSSQESDASSSGRQNPSGAGAQPILQRKADDFSSSSTESEPTQAEDIHSNARSALDEIAMAEKTSSEAHRSINSDRVDSSGKSAIGKAANAVQGSEKKSLGSISPWILRQVEPTAANDQPNIGAPATQSSSTGTSQTQSSDGVDIETLSKQVYGQIKRRLAVERERLRYQ